MTLVRPTRRRLVLLGACLGWTAAAGLAVWAQRAVEPVVVSPEAQVEGYLRGHASAADGVVVAFGHPDIVLGSGLASPYPHLWSLPVRVLDPRLHALLGVMAGPSPPRWIVVAGAGLDSWGLEPRSAQRYLESHYAERTAYADWHVWRRTSGPQD